MITSSKKRRALVLIVLIIPLFSLQAQEKREEEKTFTLTIDNIMEGPDLVGTAPSEIMWSFDGKRLYFYWKKPGDKEADFYFISKSNMTPQKITIDEILKKPPVQPPPFGLYQFSRSRRFGVDVKFDKEKKRALLIRDGDLILVDTKSGRPTQLTSTEQIETNADFTYDQKKIFFTSQGNLFMLSLQDFSLSQMTSFSKKDSPSSKEPDEIEAWYRDQQKKLFLEFKESQRETPPPAGEKKKRKPFFLKENQNVIYLNPSPLEKHVVFFLSENLPESEQTIVPNYVTPTGYTEDIDAHTKAAESAQHNKAGIMTVATGEVSWVDYNQPDRKIFPSSIYWSPDGRKCLLTASSDDREDQWLLLLDVKNGKTSVIEHVHDDAWVGPLGLRNIIWWPESQHVSYISEKSGYAHLYKASLDGKKIIPLTQGKFEVYNAHFSKDGKKWYLTTNEEHPGEHHFYSMSLVGGERKKITTMPGLNQAILSPDESFLAVTHSAPNKPPELYLQANKLQSKSERLTLSTTDKFRSFSWYEPEIITFTARDGKDVYARLYKPEKWHSLRPAVVFIHGAGYMQNVHKGWSNYYREYMFHNFLMEKGYLVLDVDYRGSAGYGRDCRTTIYRHMGGSDLNDIVDASRFLVKEYNVNPERIGTYGGSYGGFLTLMAMFTAPDAFKAGAALRPVTDWAHYNNSYTVNILNLPHKDTEAYEKSSPIYFAEGFKGALLICHGMVDTNVHFQDTVRLVQRLIELRKENWEAAIYPVEGHGFHNNTSWADEYKRIFKLFEENLK